MDQVNTFLLIGSALLFIGILLGFFSARAGFPLLLVFLIVGMLAGEDGPGQIQFNDFRISFLVGNLALAVILLDGGLRTRIETFRVGLRPAISLATIGVMLTAALVGAVAMMLFHFDWRYGLLLGAIVGSTDAAAVFAILRAAGTRLNERVRATLEIESGMNDPMAVFLTISVLELIVQSHRSVSAWIVLDFVQQFGIGTVAGVGSGYLVSWIVGRVHLGEGLYALLITSGGIAAFAVTNEFGGSGFLAVYLVGLIVGNRRTHASEDVLRAMDGLAWLAQSGMFLLLGLLVTPSEIAGIAPRSLMVALALIFIARPLAVWICILRFHFGWREIAYISWVGLRGAVPIVLALFPITAGIDDAKLLFNVAFFVVMLSLLMQGSTVSWTARLLKVEVPRSAEPLARATFEASDAVEYEFVEFAVADNSRAEGMSIESLPLPKGVRSAGVFREGEPIDIHGSAVLRSGDRVCLLAPPANVEHLTGLFSASAEAGPLAPRAFFGDFTLEGTAPVSEVAALYGLAVADKEQDLTLEALLRRRLRGQPVVGDAARLGEVELTVREMDGPRILKVGLKIR